VAVKTGTSTGFRDAWTCGFTRERVVVVWVGNADGAPTDRLTGAVGAGPVFFDVMKRAMRDVARRAPLWAPELLEEAEVCPLSGDLPGDACPDKVRRNFMLGARPHETCSVHKHARPAAPAGWACDPAGSDVIVALPDDYARFLVERPVGAPGVDAHGSPLVLASRAIGCAGAEGGDPRVVVLAPRTGTVLRAADGQPDVVEVAAETRGLPSGTALEVVVDGRVMTVMRGKLSNEPQKYAALVPVGRGDHDIEIRPADPHTAARLGRATVSVR
jgi:penicillin-binding protein 1C